MVWHVLDMLAPAGEAVDDDDMYGEGDEDDDYDDDEEDEVPGGGRQAWGKPVKRAPSARSLPPLHASLSADPALSPTSLTSR